MRVDNIFYIGEYGFALDFTTGLDMSGLADDDVKSLLKRPDGTTVATSIPAADRTDPANGQVNAIVAQGWFTLAGEYEIQVAANIAAGIVTSRRVEFQVIAPAMDLTVAFA